MRYMYVGYYSLPNGMRIAFLYFPSFYIGISVYIYQVVPNEKAALFIVRCCSLFIYWFNFAIQCSLRIPALVTGPIYGQDTRIFHAVDAS